MFDLTMFDLMMFDLMMFDLTMFDLTMFDLTMFDLTMFDFTMFDLTIFYLTMLDFKMPNLIFIVNVSFRCFSSKTHHLSRQRKTTRTFFNVIDRSNIPSFFIHTMFSEVKQIRSQHTF